MEELLDFTKEVFGDVLASGICKMAVPVVKFSKPYLSALRSQFSPPVAGLLTDLRRLARNPFGALLLLLVAYIPALGIWQHLIYPADTPAAAELIPGVLLMGYFLFFAYRYAELLANKVKARLA